VTQYFIGDFDGTRFSSSQVDPLWMDWGVDNYAGVTFDNEPSGRSVMIAWMNNWDYANQLPTHGWRGQMTLPRVLGLRIANGQLRLVSTPAPELSYLNNTAQLYIENNPQNIAGDANLMLSNDFGWSNHLMYLDLTFNFSQTSDTSSIAICFMNNLAQEVCTGLSYIFSYYF